MRRSYINEIMIESKKFLEDMNFKLPPFAYWTPEDWEEKGEEYREIKDNMLGWDITDFGYGTFKQIGLIMFTLRNGNYFLDQYIKPYAEKILIVEENQVTPYHYHWNKMEDIINRGGGNLMVQVYNSDKTTDKLDMVNQVLVSIDGRNYSVDPGTKIKLTPGESISLPGKMYHKFWGEEGTGKVLLGEVSKVNDDNKDNRFLEKLNRFSDIIEDTKPLYYLANEIPEIK